jgi:hypothetical protein
MLGAVFSVRLVQWLYKSSLLVNFACSPPNGNIKISPYTNVTLSFDSDFDFWLDHPFHGGYRRGRPTCRKKRAPYMKKKESNCHPDPSSRQRGRHIWRRKNVIVTQRNIKSGHLLRRGPDTKTNWPTDRRSKLSALIVTSQFQVLLVIILLRIEYLSIGAVPYFETEKYYFLYVITFTITNLFTTQFFLYKWP